MTLPSSGPISCLDILNEFGATSPLSLNALYEGSGIVPIGARGSVGNVPSSGQISLNDLHGVSGSLLSGASWVRKTIANAIGNLIVSSGSTLYSFSTLSNTRYVHRSTDNGVTWVRETRNSVTNMLSEYNQPITGKYAADPLTSTSDIRVIHAFGKLYSLVLVAEDDTAYNFYLAESSDGGKNWTALLSPIKYMLRSSQGSYPISFAGGTLEGASQLVLVLSVSASASIAIVDIATQTTSRHSNPNLSQLGVCIFFPNALAGTQLGGDGAYLTFGGGSYVHSSPNGVNWTRYETYDTSGNVLGINDISFLDIGQPIRLGNTVGCLANKSYNTARCLVTTTDGINFTKRDVFDDANGTILINACDSYALAVYKNSSGQTIVATSTDLINWSKSINSILSATYSGLYRTNTYWILQESTTALRIAPI